MRRLLCFKELLRVLLGLGLCAGLVIVTLAVPVPAPQGPQDPAAVLPSSTAFFLEFSQPQPIAQEVGALLKGSALEDMPAFLAQMRDKIGDDMPFWVDQSYSMLGTFLGPEGLAEAGRVKAGCVALTGFDKTHTPEFLWVLLPGDSNFPAFITRAVLTSDRNMRLIEKVEGVNLYRELNWRARFRGVKDKKDGDFREEPVQPEEKHSGPAYALMPGMVLIGSNPATVRDAILRSRGMKAEQTLAQSAGFQRLARLRERPGMFCYADLALLSNQADKIFEEVRRDFPPGRFGPHSLWDVTRALGNPKGLRTFAASLTLQRSGLDLQAQLHFDPKHDIPLLGALPDKGTQSELLHFAPGNSLAALTFSLSDGARHWEKLLGLADTVVREAGERGEAPSKALEGLEEKLKLRFGKDLFGKLTDVCLVVPGPVAREGKPPVKEGEVQAEPVPLLLILKTTGAEAAKSLESVLVESVRLIDDDKTLLPTSHEIQEQTIRSFPATPGRLAIHQGRHGSMLVIGLDALVVADALVAGTKKQGLLAQPRLAESLKGLDDPVLVGVGSVSRSILSAMSVLAPSGEGRPGRPLQASPEVLDKLIRALTRSTAEMPPAVLSLSRKPGALHLAVHQTGLQVVKPETVDTFLEWNLRRSIGEDFRFRKDFIEKKDARMFKDEKKDGRDFKDKDKPAFPKDKIEKVPDKDKR